MKQFKLGRTRQEDTAWDQFAGYAAWTNKDLPQIEELSPECKAAAEDDRAVADFSRAMVDKMTVARGKGRGGWKTCPTDVLWEMLRKHMEKGDPVDVANIAMMIWHNKKDQT